MTTEDSEIPPGVEVEPESTVGPIAMNDQSGFVYVLTNAAMPGLVKIGRTKGADPETRVSQLYTTGVPVPFDVEFAGQVDNVAVVEAGLHTAFRGQRVNPKREFFRIEPEQPIAVLKAFNVVDVTAQVAEDSANDVTPSEKKSSEQLRKRRPPLNFDEMQIPMGSELTFVDNETITVTVVEPKKVLYEGEPTAISAVTATLKNVDYYVAPTAHWRYDGRLLRDIYNDTYPTDPD